MYTRMTKFYEDVNIPRKVLKCNNKHGYTLDRRMLTDTDSQRVMEEFSLSLSSISSFIARPIYLHAAAYRSSDCKRRMLIITLSAYNRTPINDLVAGY